MDLAFFSFVTLESADAQDHAAYNRWHQLDHRPENLALPGVVWGDRWARPDAHKAAGRAPDPEHASTDYVAMYWFREPLQESVGAWDRLGEDSFQWGRGPLIPGVRRTLLGFFRPVKGYAARSALVSPEVLPFRPNRGLHITMTRYAESHSAATHARHAWEDRELIPALLDVDGVAGAWTFSFAHHQQHSTLPFPAATDDGPGSIRLRLVYLDDDTLATTARIEAAERALEGRGAGDPAPESGQLLLATPVRTIVPWQDW